LLNFYQKPENQKIRPEIFKEALEGARERMDIMLNWSALLRFYQNPENQRIEPEVFKEALEGTRKTGNWSLLLHFYQNPENQPKISKEFIDLEEKIERAKKSISDENLRPDFISEVFKYFSQNHPLSLLTLSSPKELPLLIPSQNLGIDPFVIKSWNLEKEEEESLLPLFISLSQKGIHFPFSFPFYPRKEIKKSKKHNRELIDYFKDLSFLSTLPEEYLKLIEEHLKRVKEITEQFKVDQTTLKISFPFLKTLLSERKRFKKEIFQRLKETIGIQKEIEEERWLNFIKESKALPAILTLATHYSKIYPEGKSLLGQIVSAMIEERYFQLRYNLEDEITREQLNPLLKGKSKEEWPEIIEKWSYPYFQFEISTQEKEEKEEEINWQQIANHLETQILGHNHFQGIFNLKEFQSLGKEDKETLLNFLNSPFEKKKFDVKKIREIFERCNLKEEKRKIFFGLAQLLKDAIQGQKSKSEILSTIERLENRITQHWPEIESIEAWSQDLKEYLSRMLEERKEEKEEIIYLSHFSDHPKTLLEIGKYPVATCQNFESTGRLNKKLLGYIFDSHIKALVLREVEIKEKISKEELSQSQIEIDENNEEIKITTREGKIIQGKISKPIARRIVFIGQKKETGEPSLLLEPIYSKRGKEEKSEFEELLNLPLIKLTKDLQLEILEQGKEIEIAPSHNPEGYYRDI
ncbi:MAG: hypothetical protein ACP5H3_03950, partial [Candidatus Aenigmatarchaeota archaeon]